MFSVLSKRVASEKKLSHQFRRPSIPTPQTNSSIPSFQIVEKETSPLIPKGKVETKLNPLDNPSFPHIFKSVTAAKYPNSTNFGASIPILDHFPEISRRISSGNPTFNKVYDSIIHFLAAAFIIKCIVEHGPGETARAIYDSETFDSESEDKKGKAKVIDAVKALNDEVKSLIEKDAKILRILEEEKKKKQAGGGTGKSGGGGGSSGADDSVGAYLLIFVAVGWVILLFGDRN